MADIGLDGLASGMNTEDIINKLVQIERKPIINMQREKIGLEESKSAWRDVNSRLDNLGSKLTQLKLSSTFNSNSTTSNNKDVATATATSDASTGEYQINVNQLAQTNRLGATTKISDNNIALSDPENLGTNVEGDIGINGTTITVDVDETLSSLNTKINEADAGVSSTIIDGNLVIEGNETGAANTISLTDNANNLLDNLGLNGDLNDINNDSVLQVAQDAKVEINGIKNITSSNNTFSEAVEEVTFNVSETGSATISVSQDTEKATSAVQEFVDQYNSVMDFVNTKLDYDPEEDKAGTLQGDGTLMRLQMKLRSMVTDRVTESGSYNQLTSIGVEIDREGVMSFDSSKLTESLEKAPGKVMNLFNAEKEEDGFDGVATRMDQYVDQLIQSNTGTIPRKLDFYDTRMENIDEDIADQERRLEATRQRYQEQFTAMETAMAEMQQQQSWMQQQLSSLGGTSSLISSMT